MNLDPLDASAASSLLACSPWTPSRPTPTLTPARFAAWVELQRRMTLGEKLAAVVAATEFVMRLQEDGVRRLYPEASPREVFLRAAARRLDRETMIRAYGWDPEAPGGAG